MAKFGSKMFKAPKLGKGVSSVKKKSSLLGKKGTRKSLYGGVGSKIKGKNILKGTGKKIGPIRPDLKQGGVRKINKLVESKVQNLVPKLSQKIEAKVDSFDPSKFMGKIFDGGLDSLRGFGSSLDGMKGSMQGAVDFLKEATEVASTFITKLAKAKQKKGGGLMGTLFKGLAIAGVAALAVPALANVAMFGGAVEAGKGLWKKGIDFIGGIFGKKKKEKKKKKDSLESKVKKAKKNLFKGILEKFGNTLNFLNPLNKKKKETETLKSSMQKQESFSTADGSRENYNISVLNKEGRNKGQVFTLKVNKHNGEVIGGPDNEVTNAITDAMDEKQNLEEKYRNNRMMGKRDDSDKAEAKELEKKIEAIEEEIRTLMMGGGEGIEVQDVKKFKGKGMNLEAIVEKGEEGEKGDKGVEGKKGGLGSFIQNTTQNVKKTAGKIVKSTPQYKLFSIVKENKENIKKIAAGGSQAVAQGAGSLKKKGGGLWDKVKGAAGWLGGGLKGMVDSAFGLRKDHAKAIAQPAKGKGTAGGGEGGIVPIKMEKGKDSQGQPQQPQVATLDPANKVPSLLAMDRRNLHTPYAKSTFNIVDAM